MVEGVAGESGDHPHQKSLWFTHGNVNDVDFWAEGEDCGRIEQVRILHRASGPGQATLATENRWVDCREESGLSRYQGVLVSCQCKRSDRLTFE